MKDHLNSRSVFGAVLVAAVLLCLVVVYSNSRLPFREGILAGKIVFSDGSVSNQIGTGCKVQLYNEFIIVSIFPPGTKNTTVSVYNWDQIKRFKLKELP